MEDVMKGFKVSAFGDWDLIYDEKLITPHLQSMKEEAEFVQAHFFVGDGEDLFKVLSPYKYQPRRMEQEEKKGVEREGKKLYYYEEKIRKPKAVDEDLYQIPPDLLYQVPKKKKLLWKFWAGCLGLDCIA